MSQSEKFQYFSKHLYFEKNAHFYVKLQLYSQQIQFVL